MHKRSSPGLHPRNLTGVFSWSAFFALLSSSFLLGQENLPIQLVNHVQDGTTYKAISFEAEEGYSYSIQHSSDLTTWTDVATFDGFGDTALFPFVQVAQPTGGGGGSSNPPTVSSLPYATVYTRRVQGGGTLFSWPSLEGNGAIHHYEAGISLGVEWDAFPFFVESTSSHNYIVISSLYSTVPAPVFAPMGPLDSAFKDAWLLAFPSINANVIAGFNPVAVIGGVNGQAGDFYRIVSEEADTDKDGLSDPLERLPVEDGGTGTDPLNSDSDGDGVSDGAEAAQGNDPNDDTDTPGETPSAEDEGIGGPVATPSLGEIVHVGFHGNNHVLGSDSQLTSYRDPQWVDGSHNYPVSYTRNSAVELSAVFHIPLVVPGDPPEVEVLETNGISLSPTPLDHIEGSFWKLPKTVCDGTLPNTVKYYSAQEVGKEFEITWVLRQDGVELGVQTTAHTMYLTLEDPLDKNLRVGYGRHMQETLFNIGCRMGDGMDNNTDNALVDAIYVEFTDQPTPSVARVIPTQGKLRDESMTYWANNEAGCAGASFLLASDDGNGNCGAWASLLNHIIRNQGVASTMVSLDPIAPNTRLLVNNWDYIELGLDENSTHPYTLFTHVNNDDGYIGPGGTNNEWAFNEHIITIVGNTLYDPSYGTAKIPPKNGDADYKAYEDAHISGYGKRNNDDTATIIQKNDTAQGSPSEVEPEVLPPHG